MSSLQDLKYSSVLDAFSGTSSVSYMFKGLNKKVITNDVMPCNYWISKALIENNNVTLSDLDVKFILTKDINFNYGFFIEKTFKDIYYTEEENIWLDVVVQNIERLDNQYKKAIAFWALFQSCIIKRPYNLFHRKNLQIRTADVERSFGNKTTWDKPFNNFFNMFVKEANNAIFSNSISNESKCEDVFNLNIEHVDLVYIDPPYIPQKGSITTYQDFYHFLNGLVCYKDWSTRIDYGSKHLKIKSQYSIWEDKKEILKGFDTLFKKYSESIIVMSYRDDGIPKIEELVNLLTSLGKDVEIKTIDYKYALSKTKNKEVLIIAK